MSWLRRSERLPPLPAQVREGLALARGERMLAYGVRPDGGWCVATTAAVVLIDPIDGPIPGPGTPSVRRWWHDVAEATWDPGAHRIDIRWVDDGEPTAVLLTDPPGSLPEVLRERVTSTYVASERIAVRGRRGVTVAIRRHVVSGALFSQVVLDEGVQADRPEVVRQIAEVTRRLSEQVGLVPEVRTAPRTC